MNNPQQRLGIFLGLCVIVGWVQAAQPKKQLLFPGEVFAIEGRTAFLILPDTKSAKPDQGAMPWVWYAPTLRGLPVGAKKWMFERFLKAGIATAGVDVWESYGSPMALEVFKCQGHNMWPGWFQSQALVDFVLKHAKKTTTKS